MQKAIAARPSEIRVPCCCCPGSRKRAHRSTKGGNNHISLLTSRLASLLVAVVDSEFLNDSGSKSCIGLSGFVTLVMSVITVSIKGINKNKIA